MKFIKLLLLFIILYSVSCRKDDNLSFSKTPYTGNQLKINGFFYDDNLQIYCFYNNGVVLSAGSGGYCYDYFENAIKNGFFNDAVIRAKNDRACWGVFIIENNNIKFDKWVVTNSGGNPAYEYSGNIINDTTFVITKIKRINRNQNAEINVKYHFRPYSPKPDSTNKYIK